MMLPGHSGRDLPDPITGRHEPALIAGRTGWSGPRVTGTRVEPAERRCPGGECPRRVHSQAERSAPPDEPLRR